MICPNCQKEIEEEKPVSLLSIRGKPQKLVKRTNIPKRYVWVGDQEVLMIRPIPLLIVQEI